MDDEGYGDHNHDHQDLPQEDGGIGFEDGQLDDGGFAAMGFDTHNNLIRQGGNNLFQKF
jgi:hypothetical protein